MSRPPLTPNLKSYRGSKPNLTRKNHDYNAMATRVAHHVNVLVADNPNETQQYMFARIAAELGLTTDQVRSAISDGGWNGITVFVTQDDRQELARYKRAPDDIHH